MYNNKTGKNKQLGYRIKAQRKKLIRKLDDVQKISRPINKIPGGEIMVFEQSEQTMKAMKLVGQVNATTIAKKKKKHLNEKKKALKLNL